MLLAKAKRLSEILGRRGIGMVRQGLLGKE